MPSSIMQFTLLALFCVLFSLSGVSAQTASGSGGVAVSTNGTYTVPSATSTSTGKASGTATSSSTPSAATTNAAVALSGGNVVFGLALAGALAAVGL